MKQFFLFISMTLLLSNVFSQSNTIKISLLPTAWGEIRGSYEHAVNKNQSIQVNFGYVVPNTIPNFIYDESEVEDYGGSVDIKNKLSGFTVSGEYRFYTSSSKDAPRGFYFAPYFKYNKYNAETSAGFDYDLTAEEYNNLEPEQQEVATPNGLGYTLEVTGDFDANMRQMGGGVMIGYQWLISDVVALDFNFFGLGVDSYLFNFDLSTEDVDVDYTRWGEEIKEELEDFTLIGEDIQVTPEQDRIRVRAPFVLPNIRFSISLGVAF